MVLYTMVSGLELINMVMVFKDGQTEHAMKVCGKIPKLVEKESFGILMEIFLKENGLMIKQMASEFILIQMVQVTQDFGKMTYRMEKEKNIGLMEVNTLEIIRWEKNMVRVNIGGLMEVLMMEHGLITKLRVLELIPGLMEENIQEDGKTIICTVMVHTGGKMEENMKVCMKMIKNMVLEFMFGLTGENMKVIGLRGNSTVKENIFYRMAQLRLVFGIMDAVKIGFKKENSELSI